MSKEHAYAYEAGYIDGSTHYELEHCPACKNVADLQEALAENERLRQENQSVGMAAYELGRASLAAENAKLRELVRDMMAFVEDDDACERCGHDAECVEAADGKLVLPYEDRCLMLDLFADRMRELGVEP